MKRTILTTAVVVTALFFVASAANADTYYFYCDGSDSQGVSDPKNWYTDSCEEHDSQDGQVPDANDRAVICCEQACNIDTNTTWDTIDVQAGAFLNIAAGQTLTVQNDDDNGSGGAGNDHSVVDGTISLEASGVQYGKLEFEANDHQITGDGLIIGTHQYCQILLSSDYLDLTSSITIEGLLEITAFSASSTSFVNNGYVHAYEAGTLEIDPDQIGVGSGVWCVSTSADAVLQINAPSAGKHSGDICISNGALDINNTFTTSGSLCFTSGTINVASNKTLSADGDGSCTCCW